MNYPDFWQCGIHNPFKKILIAIPIALVISIPVGIFGSTYCKITLSMFFVPILFSWLFFETPNWKLHVFVITVPAMDLALFLGNQTSMPNRTIPEHLFLMNFALLICIMSVLSFFMTYKYKVRHFEKADLKVIFIRTSRFYFAVSIFLAAYFMSGNIADKYEDSLAVQLSVYFLLPIVFFALCYIFDLFPLERKKDSRKSKLRKELEDFYLEERKKLEKKV